PRLRLLGWLIVGTLVGASIGAFDLVRGVMVGDLLGAIRKTRNGVYGGLLGGFVGGLLFIGIFAIEVLRTSLPHGALAASLVLLGVCIGLMIGLAQVILKQAWIRVEEGFRPGRELLLTKEETTIGRAEGSDLL